MQIETLLEKLERIFQGTEYTIGKSGDQYSHKCLECQLDGNMVFKIWCNLDNHDEIRTFAMEAYPQRLIETIPQIITFKGKLHPESRGRMTFREIAYHQILKICEHLSENRPEGMTASEKKTDDVPVKPHQSVSKASIAPLPCTYGNRKPVSQEAYDTLMKKYGHVSSWAIWALPGATPKSNTSDLSMFDTPDIVSRLNADYVFVGLNGSSTHGDQGTHVWTNFHSNNNLRQHDYKLRYALMNTPYWGSYITDIIKYFPEVDSEKVDEYLKDHPEVLRENVERFVEEISLLSDNPTLIALGVKAYKILSENLGHKYKIVPVMHYSNRIGKEDYREKVLDALNQNR